MLDNIKGNTRIKLSRTKIAVKFPHITMNHLIVRIKLFCPVNRWLISVNAHSTMNPQLTHCGRNPTPHI